jgi:hypothetical protein
MARKAAQQSEIGLSDNDWRIVRHR